MAYDGESNLLESIRPIKSALYRCDKTFLMDHYNEVNEENITGIVVAIIAGSWAEIYSIIGTEVKRIERVDILREKSHKKGGQSAARFQANRMCQMRDYANLIEEKIRSLSADNIYIISNAGLGQKINLNDIHVTHITADPSLPLTALLVLVPRNDNSSIEDKDMNGLLNMFNRFPENYLIGQDEIKTAIIDRPWAIKNIYVHDSLGYDIEHDSLIVWKTWSQDMLRFINDYSGCIASLN